MIKKWYQIWICPAKHGLIWFKLLCFRSILAIGWEILILNLIENFSEVRNPWSDQNLPQFCCLIYIFWHYNRNSFELKKFLIISRYIGTFYWKFCIPRSINGSCPRANEQEMTFLVIGDTRQWPSISKLFLKKTLKWKYVSALIIWKLSKFAVF